MRRGQEAKKSVQGRIVYIINPGIKSDCHGEHQIVHTLAKYVIYSTSYTYLHVKITKTLMIPRIPGKQHTFLKAKLPHSVAASSVAVTSEVRIHSANIGTV